MERRTENKIVLITRQTRLAELVSRFNTVSQARFYVEHLGADFSDYLLEDEHYGRASAEAQQILSTLGRVQTVDRAFLPNFIFGPQDTVVALGQDGLVANTIKYLSGQPVIGVNPDVERWEGVLLPFRVDDLWAVIPEVFARKRETRLVSMAKAELNTGETLYAVNDLFIGPKSHESARYLIELGGRSERQSSSGIIVSTGLGSTGWLRSIVAGAVAVSGEIAETRHSRPPQRSRSNQKPPSDIRFDWDADFLYYSVREPFPSKTSSASIVFGKVTTAQPLVVKSQMPENGVIFSDGIEKDFVQFTSGTTATITLAEKKGVVVV